jgi:hypothetical protein
MVRQSGRSWTMSRFTAFACFLIFMSVLAAPVTAGPVKPGDLITPDDAALVADLVSPGNFVLVKQGMRMNIVLTERIEWPLPYREATEKYSSQVSLAPDGTLKNYPRREPATPLGCTEQRSSGRADASSRSNETRPGEDLRRGGRAGAWRLHYRRTTSERRRLCPRSYYRRL